MKKRLVLLQALAILIAVFEYDQGLIEPPKAARGHVTSVNGKIQNNVIYRTSLFLGNFSDEVLDTAQYTSSLSLTPITSAENVSPFSLLPLS